MTSFVIPDAHRLAPHVLPACPPRMSADCREVCLMSCLAAVKLDHVIIIGGGMAGLLAAGALAPWVDLVTIVEPDELRAEPAPRAGVPQSPHSHLLLSRGRAAFEQIFPGFDAELARHVPREANWGTDVVLFSSYGKVRPFSSSIATRPSSRTLLEWLTRQRVQKLLNVRWVREQVRGLVWEDTRVIGVRVERGQLRADLVLDASGRTSQLPSWCAEAGFEPPREEVVHAHLGYASRLYHAPAPIPDFQGILMAGRPPHHPRAGAAWAIEGDKWLVTLAGASRDYPPTDEEGFLEFARSLQGPELHRLLLRSTPAGKIYGFRKTENRWRRYDRSATRPGGIVPMGDAVCAFNPFYGQGMTIAAVQASWLAELCRQGKFTRTSLPRAFAARTRPLLAAAWLLATGEDARWPHTEGLEPTALSALSHRYVDRLMKHLPTSPHLAEAFLRVMHMQQAPSSLFAAGTLARVLKPLHSA